MQYLERIEEINTERKKMQDESFKKAETLINLDEKILIVQDESFHEGIVGIVAGRLTEKYTKPSMVIKLDPEKDI
ncbi:MAG: DHHA1 domain-containing protein [bacterium]